MTKLILIAVLFFTANVAGAEEVKSELDPNGYTLGFKEQPACGGWCADGFVQAKDSCDCVKEQPEAGTHILTCHIRDKTRCMDWDIVKEQPDGEIKLLPLGGRWLDANGNCLKAFDKDGKTIPCEQPDDECVEQCKKDIVRLFMIGSGGFYYKNGKRLQFSEEDILDKNKSTIDECIAAKCKDNPEPFWKWESPPEAKESDTDKWRELCELYLGEAKAFLSDFDKKASQQIIVNAQLATAYCTRYNGALLEEIRKEFRK